MHRLDNRRLKHLWNRLRGIPIEWYLSPYEEHLSNINRIDWVGATDEELKTKASDLTDLAVQGVDPDDLLVETYALVRETASRTVGLRPFDVQVMAGIALHRGKLVEMSTEEKQFLLRSQQVLKRKRAISEMLLDGLVGKRFEQALAFYLSHADRYLQHLKRLVDRA